LQAAGSDEQQRKPDCGDACGEIDGKRQREESRGPGSVSTWSCRHRPVLERAQDRPRSGTRLSWVPDRPAGAVDGSWLSGLLRDTGTTRNEARRPGALCAAIDTPKWRRPARILIASTGLWICTHTSEGGACHPKAAHECRRAKGRFIGPPTQLRCYGGQPASVGEGSSLSLGTGLRLRTRAKGGLPSEARSEAGQAHLRASRYGASFAYIHKRRMVDHTGASWNQILLWLRRVDTVRHDDARSA
jgi:hypothetical protein